jgi:hypothetical protein
VEREMTILNDCKIYCFEGDVKKLLLDEFIKLKKSIGATYLFYSYLDTITNKTAMFFSNEEWQYQMVNNRLVFDCPLIKLGFNLFSDPRNTSFCTLWNYVKPTDKKEINVTGIRQELNIANGFTFSQQYKGLREGVSLGGDIKDERFYTQFILNPDILQNIYKIIRKILISYSSKNSENNNKSYIIH